MHKSIGKFKFFRIFLIIFQFYAVFAAYLINYALSTIKKALPSAGETSLWFFALRADQVFDPTLAFTGFSEDLLLNYAMITATSPSPLTWIPLPIAGLDFQPQTPEYSLIILIQVTLINMKAPEELLPGQNALLSFYFLEQPCIPEIHAEFIYVEMENRLPVLRSGT